MRAPHLLRNGDRFAVGHYLVAVTLDGAEEVAAATRSAPIASPAYVPGGRDLWADETDFQPAIGPKQLQPAQNGPVDWLADIPDSFHVPVASLPAKAESAPASLSAIGAFGPAGPQLLQQPPPPSGEKRSSIDAAVPLGRDANSGERVASPPQREPAVKSSGRIMSHWIVPMFGAAGLLLTAVGVATFFLTSSKDLPPAATETTQAEPLLTPGRILDQSALADPPEPVIPADNPSSNSAENSFIQLGRGYFAQLRGGRRQARACFDRASLSAVARTAHHGSGSREFAAAAIDQICRSNVQRLDPNRARRTAGFRR